MKRLWPVKGEQVCRVIVLVQSLSDGALGQAARLQGRRTVRHLVILAQPVNAVEPWSQGHGRGVAV